MMLEIIGSFFRSWRFPVLAISTLSLTAAALIGVLLLPTGDDAVGAFVEDFKVWCFGYDPATGSMEWALVAIFIVQPLVLAGVTAALWTDPLREVTRRQAAPWASAGGAFVVATAGLLYAAQPASAAPQGELPFPAEDLRTQIPLPALSLTDQGGATVRETDLAGKVTVITAVYTSCGDTCPMIWRQARQAIGELSPTEQAQVQIMAITLDPQRDTPEVVARMAALQGLQAPGWRLLTGEPAHVEDTLRNLNFAWTRDPATGVIDHANLYLVVDRGGRIAYRFTLGDRQKRWLVAALRTLVAEPPPA